MASKTSRWHVSAPNFPPEPISDEVLIRGFLLDLGASGRSSKTLFIYGDSVRRLSDFARNMGFSPLATMGRDHVRHWLASMHQAGTKPGGVHVRYRSVNRFFRWCVKQGEREDNPVDLIDPPKIPDACQHPFSGRSTCPPAKASCGQSGPVLHSSAKSYLAHPPPPLA